MTFGSLRAWHTRLSDRDQIYVNLDTFFEQPYHLLTAALESRHENTSLQWLARMSIGEFFFNMVLPEKATPMREQVLVGLQELLGPKHRLTLRAKSEVAYVRLYAGRMRASRRMYTEVLDT